MTIPGAVSAGVIGAAAAATLSTVLAVRAPPAPPPVQQQQQQQQQDEQLDRLADPRPLPRTNLTGRRGAPPTVEEANKVGISIALALSVGIATTGAFVVNDQTRKVVQTATCLRCRGVGAHQCRICMGCGKLPSAKGMQQLLRKDYEDANAANSKASESDDRDRSMERELDADQFLEDDVGFLQFLGNHEQGMDIFMKDLDEQEVLFEEAVAVDMSQLDEEELDKFRAIEDGQNRYLKKWMQGYLRQGIETEICYFCQGTGLESCGVCNGRGSFS